jgi:hypothetical protein
MPLCILIERCEKQLNIYGDTVVSKLAIDEMLKNLRSNYTRQRSQFLFLTENKIKIDWRFCETVMFLEPF